MGNRWLLGSLAAGGAPRAALRCQAPAATRSCLWSPAQRALRAAALPGPCPAHVPSAGPGLRSGRTDQALSREATHAGVVRPQAWRPHAACAGMSALAELAAVAAKETAASAAAAAAAPAPAPAPATARTGGDARGATQPPGTSGAEARMPYMASAPLALPPSAPSADGAGSSLRLGLRQLSDQAHVRPAGGAARAGAPAGGERLGVFAALRSRQAAARSAASAAVAAAAAHPLRAALDARGQPRAAPVHGAAAPAADGGDGAGAGLGSFNNPYALARTGGGGGGGGVGGAESVASARSGALASLLAAPAIGRRLDSGALAGAQRDRGGQREPAHACGLTLSCATCMPCEARERMRGARMLACSRLPDVAMMLCSAGAPALSRRLWRVGRLAPAQPASVSAHGCFARPH
jgi:hypothetical protein